MNIRFNSSSTAINNKPKVAFGHNQGVLDTVVALQKSVTPDRLNLLQAHLKDINLKDPNFVKKITDYPEKWQKALIVYARIPEIKQQLIELLKIKP